MKNFKEINIISTIEVIKCYKIVFNKENIVKNSGFYIIILNILFLIICDILYIFKYHNTLSKEIMQIKIAKQNLIPQDTNNTFKTKKDKTLNNRAKKKKK